MSRPRRATKIFSETRDGNDRRAVVTERINRFILRHEQNVCANVFKAARVAFQRSRIVRKIFFVPELRWINVDRHDNAFRMFACQLDQPDMPGMQVAHRRHQGNMLVMMPPVGQLFLQLFLARDDFHRMSFNSFASGETMFCRGIATITHGLDVAL